MFRAKRTTTVFTAGGGSGIENTNKQGAAKNPRWKLKLRELCADMAADRYLTIEKVEEGYDTNDDFKNKLQEMGIERHDLRTIFTVFEPSTGCVADDDFCDGLHAKTEEACLLAVRCRSCTKQSRAHAHARHILESWLALLSGKCAA